MEYVETKHADMGNEQHFRPESMPYVHIEKRTGQHDWVDVAEAMANSLRFSYKDTEFGNKLDMATNHSEVAHHGHEHSRHVEKISEWLMRMYLQQIISEGSSVSDGAFFDDLVALSLFSYFHDIDQQMTAVYNIVEKPPQGLSEKKGHAVGASVMVLAMAHDLATSTGIPLAQAEHICRTASLMIMRHDDPARFDQTFSSEGKIDPSSISNDHELRRAFDSDTLDIYALTPAHLIRILKDTKTTAGNMIPGSQYGLDPSFEKSHEDELQALSSNVTPFGEHRDEASRARVRAFSEIAYFADMGDMISPYTDQITRTLLTQYSRTRPVSCFHDDEMSVDDAYALIQSPEGNGFSGDDQRIFWELIHFGSISANSNIAYLPGIEAFTREHLLMGALAFETFGVACMGGQVENEIGKMYAARLSQYEKKREKRIREICESYPDGEEQKIRLERLEKLYATHVMEIQEEQARLIVQFVGDPSPKAPKRGHEYTDEQIEKFLDLSDKVVSALCERFGVSDAELEAYRSRVQALTPAVTQPYSSSDSLPVRPIKYLDPKSRSIMTRG